MIIKVVKKANEPVKRLHELSDGIYLADIGYDETECVLIVGRHGVIGFQTDAVYPIRTADRHWARDGGDIRGTEVRNIRPVTLSALEVTEK